MNDIKLLIISDLKRLNDYHVIRFVGILTFLFATAMGIFPNSNPSNYIYITIFILPVVIFAISIFIEKEEGTLLPLINSKYKTITIVFTKVIAALIIQLIPIFAYIFVLSVINQLDIQYFYLFLTYILGVGLHIVIGLSLSIISKSQSVLSTSYIVYILIFSMIPILFSNGVVPLKYQYYMIISPAFLSGVLIDNIMSGMAYSSTWLIILSVFLQVGYGLSLIFFVINPYFKIYLLSAEKH